MFTRIANVVDPLEGDSMMLRFVLAAMLCVGSAHAQSVTLGHNGMVVDETGIAIDGNVDLAVALYASESAPTALWSHVVSTQAEAGFYSLQLSGLDGEGRDLDAIVASEPTLWIAAAPGSVSGATRHPLLAAPRAAIALGLPSVAGDDGPCSTEGQMRWDNVSAAMQVCTDGAWAYLLADIPVIADAGGYRTWSDGALATSCKDYRFPPEGRAYSGAVGDGVYRIQPAGSVAHDTYCDMTTDGGGWTMCWTEGDGTLVRLASDAPGGSFGTDGYRGLCRDVPFSEVLYRNHDTNQFAWFSRDSGATLRARDSDYNTAGSEYGRWTGHGVASTSYSYQLLICDAEMYTGLFMSGISQRSGSDCYKSCNSWCNDTTTEYYRPDGTNVSAFNGLAFRENGHTNVSNKLLSMGVR